MIRITRSLSIDEGEIEESFIRASGPGGQNVNKVSSAVQLRFDARQCPSLTEPVRARLERLAGSRMTLDGVIVITAQTQRSQEANRRDALERLIALIHEAAIPPVPRRPTRPTRASKERRLDSKAKHARNKRQRSGNPFDGL